MNDHSSWMDLHYFSGPGKTKKGKCIHLTAVKYNIIMWLLNINGLFQMPSYRSGAVEAAMTHRMAKDCLWLQIMHFISSHYSTNIQGRRRYVNCPSSSYTKDPIGDNMITVYSRECDKYSLKKRSSTALLNVKPP